MQFGDWLDPDAPSDRPWEAKADFDVHRQRVPRAQRPAHRGCRRAARATTALEARCAGRVADDVAPATWDRWRDHAVTTQTGCAVALQLGVAPGAERAEVAATLARLVREADGRVATGFLGTPLVLPALAESGHFDEAYLMLLRRDDPSWLYQVEQGATTVWERWDAIRPDGSIHPGTMAPPPDMTGSDEEPHAVVQPLRLRRRDRLGLPPRGRSRSGPGAAGLPARGVRAQAVRRHRLGARLGRVAPTGRSRRSGGSRQAGCSSRSTARSGRPARSSRPRRQDRPSRSTARPSNPASTSGRVGTASS